MSEMINSSLDIHPYLFVANILVRKDGKFLVLKRSEDKNVAPGVVHPFGGKLKYNENALEGALRELMEESGVTTTKLRLKAITTEIRGFNPAWLAYYFVGDYLSGEIKPTAEGETLLLTEPELRQQKLYPVFANILDHMLDDTTDIIFRTFKYNDQEEIQSVS